MIGVNSSCDGYEMGSESSDWNDVGSTVSKKLENSTSAAAACCCACCDDRKFEMPGTADDPCEPAARELSAQAGDPADDDP
jgi:hypothetical protein